MKALPRILIIDDMSGRELPDRYNSDRAAMCSNFRLDDVSLDFDKAFPRPTVKQPVAEVVFARGQRPRNAHVGDKVENDLDGSLRIIEAGWETDDNPWALLVLDLCFYTGLVTARSHRENPGMPEGSAGDRRPDAYFGLRLLEAARVRFPDLPVVILSAQDKDAVSREYTKGGALDFLSPHEDAGHERLASLLDTYGLIPDASLKIIGNSRALLMALRSARRVAKVNRNILLRGDRGSGKELFARFIHDHTPSAEARPFETVDSGSLQASLFASELFGHHKGAFTGADRHHQGVIRRASGGDLFLDEVGNMPVEIQTGLLRVIEQRRVVPLGSDVGVQVDVRFLSATNEDIERTSAAGKFRSDLFDRLKEAGTVVVPPLRERMSDLPVLAEFFVRQAESVIGGSVRRRIDSEAIGVLSSYRWPGNIRELRNCLFVAVLDYPGVEHLMPAHIRLATQEPQDLSRAAFPTAGFIAQIPQPLAETEIDIHQIAGILPRLEADYGTLILRALRAALLVTRRRTIDNPEGEVLIQPALRLFSGSKTLTASQAADMIKRLFSIARAANHELLSDPILSEALRTAKRLRPSSSRKERTSEK